MIEIPSEGIFVAPVKVVVIDSTGDRAAGTAEKYGILLISAGSPAILPIMCDTVEELDEFLSSEEWENALETSEDEESEESTFVSKCANAAVTILKRMDDTSKEAPEGVPRGVSEN